MKGNESKVTESAETMNRALKAMTHKEEQYLTFSLDEEEYCVALLQVREVIGMMPVITVPQTPDFVKGVLNLRGNVIPVVDLRLRFGMETIDYTECTCIIVVEIEAQSGTVIIGIVVDAVSEVLKIKGEDTKNTSTFGTTITTDYILGIAEMEGDVKILLDIDRILSAEEIVTLNNR